MRRAATRVFQGVKVNRGGSKIIAAHKSKPGRKRGQRRQAKETEIADHQVCKHQRKAMKGEATRGRNEGEKKGERERRKGRGGGAIA